MLICQFLILLLWILLLAQHAFVFAVIDLSGFVLLAFGIGVVRKRAKALFYGYAYGSIVFSLLSIYHVLIIFGAIFGGLPQQTLSLFIGGIAYDPDSAFKGIYLFIYLVHSLLTFVAIAFLFNIVEVSRGVQLLSEDFGNQLTLVSSYHPPSSPIKDSNRKSLANRLSGLWRSMNRPLPALPDDKLSPQSPDFERLETPKEVPPSADVINGVELRQSTSLHPRHRQSKLTVSQFSMDGESNDDDEVTEIHQAQRKDRPPSFFNRKSFVSFVRKLQKYADGEYGDNMSLFGTVSRGTSRRRTGQSAISFRSLASKVYRPADENMLGGITLKRNDTSKTSRSFTSSVYFDEVDATSSRRSKATSKASTASSFAALWRSLYDEEGGYSTDKRSTIATMDSISSQASVASGSTSRSNRSSRSSRTGLIAFTDQNAPPVPAVPSLYVDQTSRSPSPRSPGLVQMHANGIRHNIQPRRPPAIPLPPLPPSPTAKSPPSPYMQDTTSSYFDQARTMAAIPTPPMTPATPGSHARFSSGNSAVTSTPTSNRTSLHPYPPQPSLPSTPEFDQSLADYRQRRLSAGQISADHNTLPTSTGPYSNIFASRSTGSVSSPPSSAHSGSSTSSKGKRRMMMFIETENASDATHHKDPIWAEIVLERPPSALSKHSTKG